MNAESKEFRYVGTELELFQQATTWKDYFCRYIRPYVRGKVLEVGAGIGANTSYLYNSAVNSWLCPEPDTGQAQVIGHKAQTGALPKRCSVRNGILSDLEKGLNFDAILYLDVLEHIEADGEELRKASDHVAPRGCIILLSPAHQWLFSKFDKSVGHFRRYDKRSLRDLTPPSLTLEKQAYLDSAGVMASAVNRFFLKSAMPNQKQIHFWDRILVPISKILDPALGYQLGKSVVTIWRKAT